MQNHFAGRSRISKNWLFAPPLRGAPAVAVSLAGVVIPTLIRMAMAPDFEAQSCTIFCPFVLVTAILCGWRYAAAVALGSAAACNTILMGAPYRFHIERSEFEVLGTFLGYSAFTILIVSLFRATAARSLRQAGAKERASGVIFSLDEGQAWASWYGVDAPVRLGSRDEVVKMMKNFIAQVELGERFQSRAMGGLRLG